jgi:hypothetical protein
VIRQVSACVGQSFRSVTMGLRPTNRDETRPHIAGELRAAEDRRRKRLLFTGAKIVVGCKGSQV